MEPDHRPRLAIVGAGPSGLAAAHHLTDTHQVWLFDRRNTVGGVWAETSDQSYKWLETNTPTALFPFPGFPLTASDWQDESLKHPYVSGPVAQRYYARYARINRLDEQGRLKALRVGTTVLDIKRSSVTEEEKASSQWLLTFQDAQGKQEELPFERLIIATGYFSSPSIPTPLQPVIKEGLAFHSSSFGSSQVMSRLSVANKVFILGAGKSAQDSLAYISSMDNQSRSINLVMPSHGRVSSWPLPHGRAPSHLSRMPLFGAGYLSPWVGSSLSPTWIEISRFGNAIRRYYWNSLAHNVKVTYPMLFPPSAPSNEPWRDILRSTSRLFPAPSGLTLQEGQGTDLSVLHAAVTEVVTDRDNRDVTLTLTQLDGGSQKITLDGNCDVILACTGYLPPSQGIAALFSEVNEANKMGIPVFKETNVDAGNEEWNCLVQDAVRQIRSKEPMFADLFTDEELFGQPTNTYRLYQHMVPIEQAHTNTSEQKCIERDFAVMGLPQTISASIVAHVQARWLSHYFAVDGAEGCPSLRLPSSKEEAANETAHLVAASLSRYGHKDSRQGTTMTLELAWYADLLLDDISAVPRQHKRSRQSLRALSSDDFL